MHDKVKTLFRNECRLFRLEEIHRMFYQYADKLRGYMMKKRIDELGFILSIIMFSLVCMFPCSLKGAVTDLGNDEIEMIQQGYKYHRSLIETSKIEVVRHTYNAIPVTKPEIAVEEIMKSMDQMGTLLQSQEMDPLLRAKKMNSRLEEILDKKVRYPEVFFQKGNKTRIDALFFNTKTPNDPNIPMSLISSNGMTAYIILPNKKVYLYPGSQFSNDGINFCFLGCGESLFPFSNMNKRRIAGSKKVANGQELICLEVFYGDAGRKTHEFWIDVDKGYFPVKVIHYMGNGDILSMSEAHFLTRNTEGFWFPKYVINAKRTGTQNGKLASDVETYEIKDAKFNTNMPDEMFNFNIAPRDFIFIDYSVTPPLNYNLKSGIPANSKNWDIIVEQLKTLLIK